MSSCLVSIENIEFEMCSVCNSARLLHMSEKSIVELRTKVDLARVESARAESHEANQVELARTQAELARSQAELARFEVQRLELSLKLASVAAERLSEGKIKFYET